MTTSPHPPGSDLNNIADVVRRAAEVWGDRPAIIGPDSTRSWSELNAAVDRGAHALRSAGHPAAERVVLALPTGAHLAAALFAVLRAGLVAVPVDPQHTDLGPLARRVGATLAVTDGSVASPVAVIGSAEVAGWWAADGAWRAEDGELPSHSGPGGEDLALLARAARSGPPVMLSHRALLGAVAALRGAPRLDLQPADRVLQALPLYHVVGLVTAFLPAAVAGAAVVIPASGPQAGTPVEAALAAIRDHRVSVLPAEPTLYRQLDRIPGYERALATVRLMTSGSSPLDPADFTTIRAATGQSVREGYGISESAAAVTSTLMTDAARPGSVGRPYPGVQVRVIDGRPWEEGGPAAPAGPGTAQGGDGSAGAAEPNAAAGGAAGDGDGDGVRDGAGVGSHDRARVDGGSGHAADDGAGDGSGRPGDGSADRDEAGDDAGSADRSPDGDEAGAETGAVAKQPSSDPADGGRPDQPTSGPDGEMFAELVDDGEVGPIAIRGATLFSGYWPDGHGGPGPDGWFVTGDIGYTDDAGELHLVDRAAETVTVAGFTVYPREVEDILVGHPYVADAAVVGVPGRGGDTVVAALVPQPGSRPTQDDLDEYLAGLLPPFKRPTAYQLVDVLPRTEVGRLDRDSVREGYARHRGIELGAPVQLRTTRAQRATTDTVSAMKETEFPGGEELDTRPEAAAALDELGVKLPADGSRSRRSAQDTDEDLF